jgi:hypothetical protein
MNVKQPPKTICTNCKHCCYLYWCRRLDPIPIWCKASPLTPILSAITGERTNEEYDTCKNVNDGECKKFELKPIKKEAFYIRYYYLIVIFFIVALGLITWLINR